MGGRVLFITRPNHDITTSYCCQWSSEIITEAKSRGIRVIDLYGARANKEEVEAMLETKNPGLTFFNGHGTETMICGHRDNPLIKAGENDDILKSKIVYSIACDSARRLGPICVESGAKAFIGYENKFVFLIDTSSTFSPTSDTFSKPFFDSSNQVIISLIKNNTVEESILRSKDSFRKWITYYRTHDLIESPQILPFLLWDRESLIAHGDRKSVFV